MKKIILMKQLLSPLLLLLALCSGCNKNNNPNPGPDDGSAHVYLAGFDTHNNQAAYWTDGAPTTLPTSVQGGYVSSMVVNTVNNDVYVGGWYRSANSFLTNNPCYWLNGKLHNLAVLDPRPQAGAVVYSIDVAQGAVYAAGQATDSVDLAGPNDEWRNFPAYWTGSKIIALKALDPSGGGGAFGIHMANTGNGYLPYLVGSSYALSGYHEPCYWRVGGGTTAEDNLKAHPLSTHGHGGAALDVQLIASSLYMCGFVYDDNDISIPCYWIDGQRNELSTSNGFGGMAQKIMKSGGDTYVVGSYTPAGEMLAIKPCIWKNGNRTDLPMPEGGNGQALYKAMSGFISDGDVYVTGSFGTLLCYWKNGELVKYTGNGDATAIVVTK